MKRCSRKTNEEAFKIWLFSKINVLCIKEFVEGNVLREKTKSRRCFTIVFIQIFNSFSKARKKIPLIQVQFLFKELLLFKNQFFQNTPSTLKSSKMSFTTSTVFRIGVLRVQKIAPPLKSFSSYDNGTYWHEHIFYLLSVIEWQRWQTLLWRATLRGRHTCI